jgi:hypothetical protein
MVVIKEEKEKRFKMAVRVVRVVIRCKEYIRPLKGGLGYSFYI